MSSHQRGRGGGGRGRGCFNCGQEGHMSRECPQTRTGRGGRGGLQPSSSRDSPRGGGGGGGRGGCFKCGQEGHMARECPQSSSRDGNRDGQQADTRNTSRGGYRGSRGQSSSGTSSNNPRPSNRVGRPRRDSPVRTDVRELAQTVKILTQFKTQKKGTIGTPVELIVNHFPIKESAKLNVFHYDIDIKLRRNDGKGFMSKTEGKGVRNERQTENRQIIERMIAEWPEIQPILRPNTYAYDGNKILFTIEELGIGSQIVTREVTIILDGFPEQTHEVRIQLARQVQMTQLRASNEFESVRQVMDIVLRHPMQRSFVGVGRNLYNRQILDTNTIRLDEENCEIAFGHHQSISNTESGLTANIDRVSTTFRTRNVGEPLLDFIKRELINEFNFQNWDSFIFNEEVIHFLTYKLKDLSLYTQHIIRNGVSHKRRDMIEAMARIKPRENSFETEPGNRVTLEEYFRTTYNITLQFREIPLIKVKGGTRENPKYLPAEVCHIYPNQTMPFRLINPRVQTQIVESTNGQTPLKRFDRIQKSLLTISTESHELMDNFGLEIIPKPIKLMGRQLPKPSLEGDKRKLKQTIDLKNSLFLNLSPKVKRNFEQYFNTFFDGLIGTARRMGMRMNSPQNVQDEYDLSSFESQKESFQRFIKSLKTKPQIILICIPDDQKLYNWIKHITENIDGIITQCARDVKFMEIPSGYFNNFVNEINAKLGGQNQALTSGQIQYRPKILAEKNTIVIGADVNHCGNASIAAMVGSYDKDFTKYKTCVSAQTLKKESIDRFGDMFADIVKNAKPFPQNIIIFRDGVSITQFDSVLSEEVSQIETLYKKRGFPVPKIVVYVVDKRHHTRFFLTQPNTDRNGRELFNMKSGTVIDDTITNPDLIEFHLCSHDGRLGTSDHAKYVVLRNDLNLSADELQMFAYSMCCTYCGNQEPISIPIPVKYADLAAFRAQQHADAQDIIFEAGNRSETPEQRRIRENRNIQRIDLAIRVKDNIRSLPYYC